MSLLAFLFFVYLFFVCRLFVSVSPFVFAFLYLIPLAAHRVTLWLGKDISLGGGLSPPFLLPFLPPKMVKWSDCADIDFGPTSPRLQMRTVHGDIRSLNIKVEDLIGIAAVFKSRNQVVRLTFQKPEVCALFLSQNEGIREAKQENRDISILIKDSNVEEKFVRLSGVPHNMKKGVIEQRFREFGKVLDTRWEKYHVAGDEFLYPVLSTWMIIRMTLDKPIPSYVNVGDYRALVKYIGQKPTCRLCDEPDHIGKQCPRAKTGNQTEVAPVSVPSVQKQTPSPNEEPAKQTNVEETPEISSHDKSIADNLSSDGEEEEEVVVGRSRSSTQPVVSLQEMRKGNRTFKLDLTWTFRKTLTTNFTEAIQLLEREEGADQIH